MKKQLVLSKITTSALTVIFCFLFPPAVKADFPDTGLSWYRESIHALQDGGILQGTADGKFHPRSKVTRAEMLKIAMEAAEIDLLPNTSFACFPDVEPNAWYSTYICTAKQLGFANGHIDGLFRPNGPVTVHESTAFMARTLELPINTEGESFKNWYTPYEEYASDTEVIAAERYRVTDHILRGRVAQTAERFLNIAEREPIITTSVGCGMNPRANLSPIVINGKQRQFIYSVPQSYERNVPHDVIIALHGRTNSNARVQGYMGLEGRNGGGRNGYIIAYPAGFSAGSSSYSWSGQENIDFIDSILRTLADNYCIDKNRVFVVGHSMGGSFANRLSCVRGDVVRAKAVVGSTPYNGECSGPVAQLIFHHPNDAPVPAHNGETVWQNAKARNRCNESEGRVNIGDYSCRQANSCRTGNEVDYCQNYVTWGNDPHSWPKQAGSAITEYFGKI